MDDSDTFKIMIFTTKLMIAIITFIVKFLWYTKLWIGIGLVYLYEEYLEVYLLKNYMYNNIATNTEYIEYFLLVLLVLPSIIHGVLLMRQYIKTMILDK